MDNTCDAVQLAQQLIKDAEKNSDKVKLCFSPKISEISDDYIKLFLSELYKSKDLRLKATASTVNAIFFERKFVFMLSKTSVSDLLASDRNHRRNTIGSDYKKIYSYLIGNKIIKLIADGSGYRAMSVFELCNPSLVAHFEKIFGKEIIEKQRNECLEIFNTYIKSKHKKLPKNPSLDSDSVVDADIDNDSEIDVEKKEQQQSLKYKEAATTAQPTPNNGRQQTDNPKISFDAFKVFDPKKQLDLVFSLDSLADSIRDFLDDLESRLDKYGSFRPKQVERLFDIYNQKSVKPKRILTDEQKRAREAADAIFKRKKT